MGHASTCHMAFYLLSPSCLAPLFSHRLLLLLLLLCVGVGVGVGVGVWVRVFVCSWISVGGCGGRG